MRLGKLIEIITSFKISGRGFIAEGKLVTAILKKKQFETAIEFLPNVKL